MSLKGDGELPAFLQCTNQAAPGACPWAWRNLAWTARPGCSPVFQKVWHIAHLAITAKEQTVTGPGTESKAREPSGDILVKAGGLLSTD